MDTIENFKQSSKLTALESAQLDRKVLMAINGSASAVESYKKPKSFWRKIFGPQLALTFGIFIIIVIAGVYFATRSVVIPGVTVVSAESIINEAIQTIEELKKGNNLLQYVYVETDNSAIITANDYDTQKVSLTIDLTDGRYLLNRVASKSTGEVSYIQPENSLVTQLFPDCYYTTYGTDNTAYEYQSCAGDRTDSSESKQWLYVDKMSGDVFQYLVSDPVSAQEETLKYLLNYIKPTSYAEQAIEIGEKTVAVYKISFTYDYTGFLNHDELGNVTYQADIYFDQATHLPVKVIDTRISGDVSEVFQTEYQSLEYSNVSQADRDQIFALDINNYQTEDGSDYLSGVSKGKVEFTGTVTSANSGEIYNQVQLSVVDQATGKTTSYWLEGNDFYNFAIARESILAKFLVGKEVQIKGTLVENSDYKLIFVDSYTLLAGD